ncbi:hypothetical protein B0J11DRAFT_99681 [Dendryphion nanum]|uniref:HMG box domain-containing protein n=1 Tax=Dendryphion nanum TaxID=256645 RepID=A0A9P9DCJ9_9PLEO|nr:hypothetical protein B0J11DRAFT_99681 [Dendryphion nanum]
MLASRHLPPPMLHRPPAPPLPVATFYNVPRRYIKSIMQMGHDTKMTDSDSRIRRKSSRIQDLHLAPTSHTVEHGKDVRTSSPTPFSPRTNKRRAISLNTEVNGVLFGESNSPIDFRAPPSALSTGSGELSGHVCLCQPEPKIPRPRNAFILYRQYHQHAIVARNPGLPNPDISKIIGEQWKSESADQKLIWQNLAQEEKSRHQEQYPDYRYQPRRIAKNGSISSVPSPAFTIVEKYRCSKCGGRSIKTPTSPFLTASPTLPPINAPDSGTPTTLHLPSMTSNLSLDSPAYRRRGLGPSSLSNIQVPSPVHGDSTMYSSGILTPDSKRRCYNNYPTSSAGTGKRPDAPGYHGRRDSLPAAHILRPSPPKTATMPPPRTPRGGRRSSVDLNLLVPNQHDQSRSVEAMVMSVPYPVKVKVLGRITPPLKDPGPTSPAISVRGAIIAIEGDNLVDVKELSDWLKDFLSKEPELSPRIFEAPQTPREGEKEVAFEDYLDLIRDWHGKSKELIQYITTPLISLTSSSSSDNDKMSEDSEKEDRKEKEKNNENKRENQVEKEKEKEKENEKHKESSPSSQLGSPKPIAILPTYQLSASDIYTSRIPIQDAYSPTDHWQWMATLWRGTVGPDLTVYVNSLDPKDQGHVGKQVDVNEEVRLLTVKKEKNRRIEESALRRVGFEVGEWVRGMGTRGR